MRVGRYDGFTALKFRRPCRFIFHERLASQTTWIFLLNKAMSDSIFEEDMTMPKAYIISSYRKISDPEKLAAYAKLAGPAIMAAGGRFLARGVAAKAMEDGRLDRTVIIEFDSLEAAMATYDSAPYQEALVALGNAVERDMRVVEGVA
jgi:uncharacterized protein (DUF1330 family)